MIYHIFVDLLSLKQFHVLLTFSKLKILENQKKKNTKTSKIYFIHKQFKHYSKGHSYTNLLS